jgi:hypothetical protein
MMTLKIKKMINNLKKKKLPQKSKPKQLLLNLNHPNKNQNHLNNKLNQPLFQSKHLSSLPRLLLKTMKIRMAMI